MAHLLQDPEEFTGFCQLLKNENVRSYLEIGSHSGGSIEAAAKYLPVGSRIVSIDLPHDQIKQTRLKEVLAGLNRRGYDARLFVGDSTSAEMIWKAKKFGPYDAVFIDANHKYAYVSCDWKHYGALGRIVGFHEVAKDGPGNGASRLFQELKKQYRYVEFISDKTRLRTDGAFGIGVVWVQ